MNENNNQAALIPLDMSTAIQYATEEYIATLDLTQEYSVDELKAGVLESIHSKFDEHNVISEKGNKWSYPKTIPNACIADLIRRQYHVLNISWTNKDETSYLAVYQHDGDDEGLYIGSYDSFSKLVYEYNYNATRRDIDEVMLMLRVRAKIAEPNTNPDLIAVNNGIYDYRTKQLMPFSPEFVFTAKSKVNYVDNAPNPHITMPDGLDWDVESWFETLSDDPKIVKLLWEVVGSIIRPHVHWDKCVCLYSSVGMNGKGTLCHLMKQLCGMGSFVSMPFYEMTKHSILKQLITSTAIITDENSTTEFTKNADNFKAIVTKDTISFDQKYKDAITIKPSVTMVQCINALPRISDNTDSLYRRFLIIPFEKTFKGEERKYIKTDYLCRKEVLEYVMYKVLNTDYYEYSNPDACERLLDEYKAFNDPVREFLDEMLEVFVWNLVPYEFLWKLFDSWRKETSMGKDLGKNKFLSRVRDIIATGYSDEWNYTVGDQKERVTSANMGKPEHLIARYNLTDWMAPHYKGTDVDKICMPALSVNYRGIFRT